MVSCSQPSKNQEQVQTQTSMPLQKVNVVDTVKAVVDTSFYKIAYMVLKTKGRSQTKEYVNNQIVFDTKKWRYTVWTKHPHDDTPVFSVCRRPKGTTSKNVLEIWSVNINDGAIYFFLNPQREGLWEGKYSNVDTKQELSKARAEELQKYFQEAQDDCVAQILKNSN